MTHGSAEALNNGSKKEVTSPTGVMLVSSTEVYMSRKSLKSSFGLLAMAALFIKLEPQN